MQNNSIGDCADDAWFLAIELGIVLLRSNLKNLKSPNLRFLTVFTYCVTNLIKTVFKYEMPSAAFTWPNLYSLDLSVVALCLWSIILCPTSGS